MRTQPGPSPFCDIDNVSGFFFERKTLTNTSRKGWFQWFRRKCLSSTDAPTNGSTSQWKEKDVQNLSCIFRRWRKKFRILPQISNLDKNKKHCLVKIFVPVLRKNKTSGRLEKAQKLPKNFVEEIKIQGVFPVKLKNASVPVEPVYSMNTYLGISLSQRGVSEVNERAPKRSKRAKRSATKWVSGASERT